MKVFYRLLLLLWVCVARHAQSTQNNTFARFVQYLKENANNYVGFLPGDNHQRVFFLKPLFTEKEKISLKNMQQYPTGYI